MKKNKRILSLALALIMMFTFMAMSASAASIEVPEIQPRFTCSYCGGLGLRTEITRKSINSNPFTENARCTGVAFAHAHYYAPSTQRNFCASCGNKISSLDYDAVYCYYKGYLS